MEAVMEEKKYGYKDVLTQKEYCKLIIANTISRFGDSLDSMAFTWLVYQVTGSAAWSAIVFAMNQLPSVLIQPFAGVLVERMNKKRLMVITDIIRGFLVAGIAALYLLGYVNPLILVLFTLFISTVEAFRMPAGMAIVPKIIEPELYAYGSSLNSTISSVVQLIGLGCAGVIIGFFGIHLAILIDAVTFFCSGLIIMTMKVRGDKKVYEKVDLEGYISDLKGGLSYLKTKTVVRNFCIMGVIVNALVVPINSLQSPLVSEVLGQGGQLLSVFGIAMTLGMGIGSLIYPKVAEKLSTRTIIVISGIAIGLTMYLFTVGAFFKTCVIAVYCFTALVSLVMGLFVSLFTSVLGVQFVKSVEEEYLARVGSIFNALATASMPITSFIVSILVTMISTETILIAGGILCVILFIVIAIKKVKFE